MSCPIEHIHQNCTLDTLDILQVFGMGKFLVQADQMKEIPTRMGFMRINEDYSYIKFFKITHNFIHGGTRYATIWSSKTTKFNE